MFTISDATPQIDTIHARAICDEIGDRLRGMLRLKNSEELPPGLKELMKQLAGLEKDPAPSIVPSLDNLIAREPPVNPDLSEGIAAMASEEFP
jgi:hypothetical protein